MAIRRYTIHPPQLVGRLSMPPPQEDPVQSFARLVGQWDAAMQELQRYLKYAQDANDTAQTGQGIVGVDPAGEIHHPNVLSRDLAGAHPASAITSLATGGLAATNVQAALTELDVEKVDFEVALMIADLWG